MAGCVVGDAALSSCVARARRAIGMKEAIATVRGYGYRFVAEVREVAAGAAASVASCRASDGEGGRQELPFVGRARELALLQQAMARAEDGRGSLILIEGEPGIGKTRLVREALRPHAGRIGHYLGRAYEGGDRNAFWPWAQILRAMLQAAVVPQVDGSDAAQLARLVPLPGAHPPPPARTAAEARVMRTHLMESVRSFLLRAAAASPPLVLVVEDVQWCDPASLLLGRVVAEACPEVPLLLLVTCRSAALRGAVPGPLSMLVEQAEQRVSLRPFGPALSRSLLDSLAGKRVDPAVARRTLAAARGNPLLVRACWEHLVSGGAVSEGAAGRRGTRLLSRTAVPRKVEAIVRSRLPGLGSVARDVLEAAAAWPGDVGPQVLARALGLPRKTVVRALHVSERAGLLERVPGAKGRYRFSHDLVAAAVYRSRTASRRARVHRLLASALDRSVTRPEAALLCRHYERGRLAAKATGAALQAAAAARRMLAFESAAALLGDALRLVHSLPRSAASVRHECRLLTALGNTWLQAGQSERAKGAFAKASGLARQAGAAELFAEAAIGIARHTFPFFASHDPAVRALLEEALGGLRPRNRLLRAQILVQLAILQFDRAGEEERRAALVAEALGLCRGLPPVERLRVLQDAQWAQWAPDRAEQRLRSATELLELAGEGREVEGRLQGHVWRFVAQVELGRIGLARRELRRYAPLVRRYRVPRHEVYVERFRALCALLDGRFDDQRAHGRRAHAGAQRLDPEMAWLYDALARFGRLYLQGRAGQMLPELRRLVRRMPHTTVSWLLPPALVQAGERTRARRALAALLRGGLPPRDGPNGWLAVAFLAGETAAAVDLVEEAQRLAAR